MPVPVRPSHLSEYAEKSLAALAAAGLGHAISVGGADSLSDRVASKMVALVERGAPRDFRDIYIVCHAGLMTPAGCWSLWRQRQHEAGSDTDPHRARLAVETHLARISQHRPLDAIADPDQRAEAGAVRSWFTKELLHAHLD